MPGRGLHGLLLNVGGDLRVCGEAPRTLGIAAPWADSESTEPIALLEVKDRAVSTSGSSQRGFRINGQWYSHILDPRTGLPADRIASATVIAARSIDADALATICNVLDARAEPAAGELAAGRRVPDHHQPEADHPQRRLASLRTGTVHAARSGGGRAAAGRRGTANRNVRGPARAGRGCFLEP